MSDFQYAQQPSLENKKLREYPRASIQHRLGGIALDVALVLTSAITLFLGWFIWSLVLWGQGQTPAKQLLKMRVYSIDTGRPASWGHMAVRQFLIPFAYSCISIPFFLFALGGHSIHYGTPAELIVPYLGNLAVFAIQLTDALWIFKGSDHQRLTDIWARTYVVNEA